MSQTLYRNFKKSIKDPQMGRKWQSAAGITIFTIFVISSLAVSQSVQALNQAAGNYGYYSGTYGYNASTTSSDAVPSAPTALTTSSMAQTSVTVSWTSPTTTTTSTSYNNPHATTPYLIHYSTSSLSACSGGTSTNSTTSSVGLTGLTAGTTYYVAVCAYDTNLNTSAALTGSFATLSTGGSSGVTGGGGGGVTGPTYPTGPAVAPAPVAAAPAAPVAAEALSDASTLAAQVGVARNTVAEATNTTSVNNSSSEFGVTLASTQVTQAANFVTYGTSTATQKLGSGERLALVRDAFDSLQRFPNNPTAFFEQLATGQKPTERNVGREVAQLRQVLPMWEKLMGRRPNFSNAAEDLAWNTMMYRVRFTRDLNKERVGIGRFRNVFGKTPTSPLDWSAVRAWGYVLATR